MSLGEMVTYIPISGAFTSYAARFVDPSLGFSMGWIYWFSWAVTFALELAATGVILQYWVPNLNIAIPISIFLVAITFLNFLPVSIYGEVESGLCVIKILTVIGFIIFAICIDFGAGQQGKLFFHNWKHPSAFASFLLPGALGKFVGFWAVLIQAGFAYQGTELVGITAGEAENPRKTVPAAIRKTFYRILFFFVFTIFFIGLLVPSDNPNLLSNKQDATASPFVIAAQLAGVSVLPGFINGVLLFVVLSAANSNVYSGSRILVGLANESSAPAFFARTSKKGVPYWAVAFTAAFGLFAFLNLCSTGGTVLTWLTNITGVAGFITWACINLCHISFIKALSAQGISRDILPYKAMCQPWFAWYGLSFNVLIILTQGFTSFVPKWSIQEFFTNYVSLIIFVALYVGHKYWKRNGFVKAAEADVTTGCVNGLADWTDVVVVPVLPKGGWWKSVSAGARRIWGRFR